MLGLEPRVAFLSFSTFGYPVSERATKMHRAPLVLERAASTSSSRAR
jgi:malate dehydrogenase (oxaloacetate-decarboxylating)(NADP+)